MKANFKTLSLAAAVAAASAGYAGVANAQAAVAANSLGDLAIVPYYTTIGDFVTGVHIINTSAQTQVVKIRLRRASDSMDALDFNLVLSPEDEWTGFISSDDDAGDITFKTNDTSCTAPMNSGTFTMPTIYRNGADTGYIEVIGMGQPTTEGLIPTGSPVANLPGIAVAAKHGSDGVPADCAAVASNFFSGGVTGSVKGNVTSTATVQQNSDGSIVDNAYVATTDVLKVSYFIRDGASGIEFGNNAVHISGFMPEASMTNQETGVFSGDLQGFDFPDLNGAAPRSLAFAARTNYAALRAAIGGSAIINDWSANQSEAGFTVGTDWVVTVPGQYTMLDLFSYLGALLDPEVNCLGTVIAGVTTGVEACDYRDIPLTASFSVWDREEQGIVTEDGDLVVSPSLPGTPNITLLDKEVNVIEWGVAPVLEAPASISVSTPAGSVNGWARLAVSAWTGTVQAVCDFTGVLTNPTPTIPLFVTTSCSPTAFGGTGGAGVVANQIPMVGFVAWERSFSANPDANYGRIVEHSYTAAASGP